MIYKVTEEVVFINMLLLLKKNHEQMTSNLQFFDLTLQKNGQEDCVWLHALDSEPRTLEPSSPGLQEPYSHTATLLLLFSIQRMI